jgi:hypothetical protein
MISYTWYNWKKKFYTVSRTPSGSFRSKTIFIIIIPPNFILFFTRAFFSSPCMCDWLWILSPSCIVIAHPCGLLMQPFAGCMLFSFNLGRIKVIVPFHGWLLQPLLAACFSFLPSAGRIKVNVPLRGWYMQPLLAACFLSPSLRGSDTSDCPPPRVTNATIAGRVSVYSFPPRVG